jgi:predicted nucleic acid-binding protein
VIVVDTNIVSEWMRDRPDPAVLAWGEQFGPSEITFAAITVEEIERGLGRMPLGKRRRELERRWFGMLAKHGDAVLPYDTLAARAMARIQVQALDDGRPLPLADSQIAGICIARSATLATRNTKDFDAVDGLSLVNPFDA